MLQIIDGAFSSRNYHLAFFHISPGTHMPFYMCWRCYRFPAHITHWHADDRAFCKYRRALSGTAASGGKGYIGGMMVGWLEGI